MAVESWIDEIAKLWEISDGKGGTVKSFRVYDKNEFPSKIATFPSAITYTLDVENSCSQGGPCIDYWTGVTEFHLFPNTDPGNIPAIMLFFARIRNAAAANITLSSKVAWFLLAANPGPSIKGPLGLAFGGEESHYGLLVYWRVKENVSGQFTVA
jgi:hypothetical protein